MGFTFTPKPFTWSGGTIPGTRKAAMLEVRGYRRQLGREWKAANRTARTELKRLQYRDPATNVRTGSIGEINAQKQVLRGYKGGFARRARDGRPAFEGAGFRGMMSQLRPFRREIARTYPSPTAWR